MGHGSLHHGIAQPGVWTHRRAHHLGSLAQISHALRVRNVSDNHGQRCRLRKATGDICPYGSELVWVSTRNGPSQSWLRKLEKGLGHQASRIASDTKQNEIEFTHAAGLTRSALKTVRRPQPTAYPQMNSPDSSR